MKDKDFVFNVYLKPGGLEQCGISRGSVLGNVLSPLEGTWVHVHPYLQNFRNDIEAFIVSMSNEENLNPLFHTSFDGGWIMPRGMLEFDAVDIARTLREAQHAGT